MKKLCVILLLYASIAAAQTDSTYTIPFASKGNTIELTVANTSKIATQGVSVSVSNVPSWVKFDSTRQTIKSLTASTEQTATFAFTIDKSAPVGKGQTLTFSITANGQTWTKNIAIKVAAPQTYTLFQNYPNPYNPSTVISYQLSEKSSVNLKVYDVIGREVANLVNEQQAPGYYQKTFDASRFASGMYICRLVATDEQNKQHVFQKKMLMLK
ncbi:MAG: T9SS type A sorting domain-containing protein [Bacteroidota bacterium]